jgi:DNA polymerase
VPPEEVIWQAGDGADLFATDALAPPPGGGPAFAVPRAFLMLAESIVLHRDPERFALLYAMLLRLRRQPQALEDEADPLARRLEAMAKSVRRDIHKMRAFLRFREVEEPDGAKRSIAWFEPEHHIVRANAGFFVRRFPNMAWSILTPDLSVHWDGEKLREGSGATKDDAAADDPAEAVWKTYYAAIFNPARLKVGAMLKEMPKKYWKNMPETTLVPQLVATAQAREAEMVDKSRTKAAEAPRSGGAGDNLLKAWEAVRDEAKGCTRCDLYRCGTQTVFGEGPLDARIMFLGEQPGDQEDLAGKPFVGPAGRILNQALDDAGVDRTATYVTNAVKHFKFERRGKRRIHQKPDGGEIMACRFWLEQERSLIQPPLIVALGATAARSIFERVVSISSLRGKPHKLTEGGEAWVTVHPSFLLRVRDNREAEYAKFVEDLHRIGERAKALV